MTDSKTERRQLIDPKALTTILIGVLLSGISAFVAAYLGTQTRTAVLERAVATVERAIASVEATVEKYAQQQVATANEMRGRFDQLSRSVTDAREKTAGEVAELRTNMSAKDREIAEIRRQGEEMKTSIVRGDDRLADAIKLESLRIDNVKSAVSEIKGELNAKRKLTEEK